jgi:RNA polymerase sigma-70 factor (ECF subfamily)
VATDRIAPDLRCFRLHRFHGPRTSEGFGPYRDKTRELASQVGPRRHYIYVQLDLLYKRLYLESVAIDQELEATIANHLASGDLSAAATAALQGLGPQILGYLTATLRDDDVAYDVFGQFSEELWKSIGTFRAESSFKTWAYKLVMHAVGRHRRDPYRRRGQAMGSEASAIALDIRSRTPPFKRTEVKDKIAKLRESLDPEDQTLLFLRIDQNLPWNEVAAIMSAEGEPVEAATLRKRLERAKERLRKLATSDGLLDE